MMNETQDLFTKLIENSPGAYVCLKKSDNEILDYHFLYSNNSFEEMFGKNTSKKSFLHFLTDTGIEPGLLVELINKVESTGNSCENVFFSRTMKKHYKISVFMVTSCCVSCLFFDVSDCLKREDYEIYKYVSGITADGFQYINNRTGFSIASSRWYEIFKIKEDNPPKEVFLKKLHFDFRDSFENKIVKTKKNKEKSFHMEYCLHEEKVWIDHTASFLYDEYGECVEEIHYYKDITKRKEKQLELEHMAYFDTKTKTYNRKYFLNYLMATIEKAKNKKQTIELMYIDIDNFKKINDSIGFTMGDELIHKFSKILLKNESKNVKIGRICNDEFVISICKPDEDTCSNILYAEIVKELEKPIRLSNGIDVYLRISVGVSFFPESAETADELIKAADIAMYSVKGQEKNSMIYFEKCMMKDFMENVNLEHRLKEAVKNEDFYLCFQPQFDTSKGTVRGIEALIRWKDGNNGLISPTKFIPMAEKAGYIIEIGKWVMKEALKTYGKLKHQYNFTGIISINISTIQLKDIHFPDLLAYHTKENDLNPSDVEIEITESVFMGDAEMTVDVLNRIRKMGFKISLDDFGTGYSSLSYLKDVPIHTLKIDKSFVDGVVKDEATGIIIRSVIRMVRELGLETIAEGVETQEQYDYLKKMKCDNIQGFFLGQPLKRSDLFEVIMQKPVLFT